MAVKYEVMAKTGTYTAQDGTEKNRWQKCGVILSGDKGFSLKLECIPVGEWNGWFSLFEPKPREEQAKPVRQSKPSFDDMDDDTPW